MTTGSLRTDAGRSGERRGQRKRLWRLPALSHALAGLAFGLVSLWAQGATDSADAPPHASSTPAPVSVSPGRIELSDSMPTVVVTVRNDDHRKAMVVFLQPMIWTQDGIAPHYELTSDVIAEPATLTVPPGTTQRVQVQLQAMEDQLSGQDLALFWRAQAAGSELQ